MMIFVNIAAAAAKYSPPVAAVAVAGSFFDRFDPLVLAGVFVGLIAGAVWRMGDIAQKGQSWDDIRSDLIVSLFTGLANFLIAFITAQIAGFDEIGGAAVGLIVGAKGTDAMGWFRKRFIGEK